MSTPAYATRTLDDIAEVIKHADGECVFLIGAGCSKSAGIPLAAGLLKEIEQDFPHAYARARDWLDLHTEMNARCSPIAFCLSEACF